LREMLFFETEYFYVAHIGLKFTILLPQLQVLGL
jgi:hypothetical protein